MVFKTLSDAVEASLKNARIAISDADRFLDAIKEETKAMAERVRTIEEIEIVPLVEASANEEEEDVLKALRPGGWGIEDEEHDI